MQRSGGARRYSASDLVNFAACRHLTHLDLINLETPLPKADDTEEMVLIQDKGFAHECRYWQHLLREHPDAVDLSGKNESDEALDQSTRSALRGGADVVSQGSNCANGLRSPCLAFKPWQLMAERSAGEGDE